MGSRTPPEHYPTNVNQNYGSSRTSASRSCWDNPSMSCWANPSMSCWANPSMASYTPGATSQECREIQARISLNNDSQIKLMFYPKISNMQEVPSDSSASSDSFKVTSASVATNRRRHRYRPSNNFRNRKKSRWDSPIKKSQKPAGMTVWSSSATMLGLTSLPSSATPNENPMQPKTDQRGLASPGPSRASSTSSLATDVTQNSEKKKHPRITINIDTEAKPEFRYTVMKRKQDCRKIIENSTITPATSGLVKVEKIGAVVDKQNCLLETIGDSTVTISDDSDTSTNENSEKCLTSITVEPQQHKMSRKLQLPNLKSSNTPHKTLKYESLCADFKFKQPPIELDPDDAMPNYRGYQLLGGSQLLRFAEQILDFYPFVFYTVVEGENRMTRRLGYCVSGQKIQDLEHRLSKLEYKLSKKVVVLIGTNDILERTPLSLMFEGYRAILTHLKTKTDRIVLLTLPPLPQLVCQSALCYNLQVYNEFIKKCADGSKVVVLDLASQYMDCNNAISLEYFEQVINKGGSSSDLVHLNTNGFGLLKTILYEHLDED